MRLTRRLALPRRVLSPFLAALAGLLVWVSPALGATIGVTTATDELSADGKCSLREAAGAANDDSTGPGGDCAKGSGADKVSVPTGHFTLGIAGIEDANASGDLDVLSN